MVTRVFLALAAIPCLVAQAQERNPFLQEWKTPFQAPPFNEIKEEHFLPAFKEGMARQKQAVDAIINSNAKPTFKNTIEAYEWSSPLLERVGSVFSNLAGAETNEKLQAINRELAPMLSAHNDDLRLNEKLWQRVKVVWENRSSEKLNAEQSRLLERTYKSFTRAGAGLSDEAKEKMREINSELSSLSVKFGDNILAENNRFRLVIDSEKDLAGLPEGLIAQGAAAAKAAGLEGKWVYTLQGPSIWPFLTYSENREFRKKILEGYLSRGDKGDEYDNKAITSRIAALRVARANLLGYKTWADFILEENMAKDPKGVYGLLELLWKPAMEKAREELAEQQALADAQNDYIKIAPWDWRFYSEKVRKSKFDMDESELKPYFAIDKARDGAFMVAAKLYGITFHRRNDIPVYHQEVQAFEVKEKNGRHLGLFLVDFHPRPGKRGGAWCSAYRGAKKDEKGKQITPVIVNVCNFTRPVGDAPALLTLDEVRTLFHEFGHALHSLFYAGSYRGIAGTPRDFVELPSQIMEHWATEPQVLKTYARHWKTGEVMPDAQIEKIQAADKFGNGFIKGEYLAASLLDMDWHTLTEARELDVTAFEKQSLEKMGVLREIPPRYRTTYFNHIWASGYSAGYYAYIWAAVLDSDAYQAFKEAGDIFDQKTADRFRKEILSRGGVQDGATLYKNFRGRDPKVEALLDDLGLR
ncbi:MAG: M3 family metallopeptidase [Holophagales bacterium]|jgi:peptidyl-dipeptidase Dcp|nr:M3 family metallopeptidase [Holophagales bacterium]